MRKKYDICHICLNSMVNIENYIII